MIENGGITSTRRNMCRLETIGGPIAVGTKTIIACRAFVLHKDVVMDTRAKSQMLQLMFY